FVGLDIKALRTQEDSVATHHLSHSREIFLLLLEVVKSLDRAKLEEYRKSRNYEDLELFIIKTIMGKV
ncbi:MAG: xylose isomerase, partial [Spirochaetia bacterium]